MKELHDQPKAVHQCGRRCVSGSLLGQQTAEWGGPVLDIHLYLWPDGESNVAHMTGSVVTKAVLLTRMPSAYLSNRNSHPSNRGNFGACQEVGIDPQCPGATRCAQECLESVCPTPSAKPC